MYSIKVALFKRENSIIVTIPFDKTGFEKNQLRIDTNKILREASKHGNIRRELENISTPNESIRRELENINDSYENINFILEEYGNLTPIDLVYKLLVENNRYTRFDLMELTGFSRSKIDRIIKQLKSIGKTKGKTSNKNGEWIIK